MFVLCVATVKTVFYITLIETVFSGSDWVEKDRYSFKSTHGKLELNASSDSKIKPEDVRYHRWITADNVYFGGTGGAVIPSNYRVRVAIDAGGYAHEVFHSGDLELIVSHRIYFWVTGQWGMLGAVNRKEALYSIDSAKYCRLWYVPRDHEYMQFLLQREDGSQFVVNGFAGPCTWLDDPYGDAEVELKRNSYISTLEVK